MKVSWKDGGVFNEPETNREREMLYGLTLILNEPPWDSEREAFPSRQRAESEVPLTQ